MESKKNDILDNKLQWDLLPLEEIEDIVKVYTAGADKYGPNKWQGLEDGYNRYKGALLRHLVEYEKGNEYDDETKCRHLAQVAWNAIAMLYTSKHKTIERSGFELGSIGTEKKEVVNTNYQTVVFRDDDNMLVPIEIDLKQDLEDDSKYRNSLPAFLLI